MPNEMKPFGQVKRGLAGAVVIFGLTCGTVAGGEWPLEFPAEKFKNIPDGQGMRFFHGVWEPVAPFGGGPVKIKTGRIESGNPVYSVVQYRVLYEAPNYVLVVEQYDPPDVEYPTTFAIYTLQSFGDPVTQRKGLMRHPCGYGIWGTKEAFDWPTEKLLETFKTSMCIGLIEFDGLAGIGWGHTRWVRVPAK